MNQIQIQSDNETEFRTQTGKLCDQASRCQVLDESSFSRATDLKKLIQIALKRIEEDRKATVAPFNAGVKALNDRYKRLTAPLTRAGHEVGGSLGAYAAQREREAEAARKAEQARREAEALAEAEQLEAGGHDEQADLAINEGASTVVAAPVVARGSFTGATSTMRKTWAYEVVNAANVPARFVIIDQAAIRAAIRGGARDIPGLRIFQKSTLVTR